jgi:transcription elongation factor GreA
MTAIAEIDDSTTLGEAVATYFEETRKKQEKSKTKGSLGPSENEVKKFAGWYGEDKTVGSIRRHNIESYAESMGPSNPDNTRRAEHIREFLRWLDKGRWPDARERKEKSLASQLRLKKTPKTGGVKSGPEAPATVELTADGIAALEAEYATLEEQRLSVREDIRRAMQDKDFRENSPLDAAKDKQGHIEARAREIQAMLKRAVVVDGAAKTGRVRVGSKVRVKNLGNQRVMEYLIVGPTEANAAEGKISSVSPVGQALIDSTIGDEVEVEVPAGTMKLAVEAIEG